MHWTDVDPAPKLGGHDEPSQQGRAVPRPPRTPRAPAAAEPLGPGHREAARPPGLRGARDHEPGRGEHAREGAGQRRGGPRERPRDRRSDAAAGERRPRERLGGRAGRGREDPPAGVRVRRGGRLDRGRDGRLRAGRSTTSRSRSSGSTRRSRPRARCPRRSCSRRAPKGCSTAWATSTRSSGACRPSRRSGADVLYAPGLRTLEQMRTVVRAVTKPVNVVMGFADPTITLEQLARGRRSPGQHRRRRSRGSRCAPSSTARARCARAASAS